MTTVRRGGSLGALALLTAVQMAGPLCFGKLGVGSESAAGFVHQLR